MVEVEIVVAVIAAVTAFFAAIISLISSRMVVKMESRRKHEDFKMQFVKDKLSKLYYPMYIHLMVTNALFKRYFESNTTDDEKTMIEHGWKEENSAIEK